MGGAVRCRCGADCSGLGLGQEVLLLEGRTEREMTCFQCRADVVSTWILSDVALALLIDTDLLLGSSIITCTGRLRSTDLRLLRIRKHRH